MHLLHFLFCFFLLFATCVGLAICFGRGLSGTPQIVSDPLGCLCIFRVGSWSVDRSILGRLSG